MRNLAVGLAVGALSMALVAFRSSQPHTYSPPNGFVPDSLTATRIAVAIWAPIYGELPIAGERPYRARLQDGVWIVEGSLRARMSVGGVARAEIAKKDGRILRVTHGK